MTIQTILTYINSYGYLIIFLFLFFGVVGIPAPEESLLFLIGVLTVRGDLSFWFALLFASFGAFIGMLTAYVIGKYVGYPFINKYGKYVGITSIRWEKAQNNYTKNIYKTVLFGFYMPGIRQISPYFAGIANIRFSMFFSLSLLGTLLWIIPYVVGGYYSAIFFNINIKYIPFLGILLLVLFLTYSTINFINKKRR